MREPLRGASKILVRRGGRSNPPDGPRVHVPDWIEDWVIVRVEGVFFKLRMTSDVNLRDTVCRDAVDVLYRFETVILRRNVNIVHFERNAAVGCMDDLIQKLPPGHLGLMEFCV